MLPPYQKLKQLSQAMTQTSISGIYSAYPRPDRPKTAEDGMPISGMPISQGIMCWCTRTQVFVHAQESIYSFFSLQRESAGVSGKFRQVEQFDQP
jgi:hypothetical protein